MDKLRSVASSAVVASSMGKVEALRHDSQHEKILVIQLHVLLTIIGNAPTQEGSNTETVSPQASGAGSLYQSPAGLITRDYLHRVFKKVMSACLSSGDSSLKRLAGSRASPS